MKLKVCGIKSVEEAVEIVPLGVDLVGLNFIPVSTRCTSLKVAKDIAAVFRPTSTKLVALFADQPLEMVNDYTRQLGVDYVQLHGDESVSYAKRIPAAVIKAISVAPTATADDIAAYINDYPADYFVLDRHLQGRGEPVDPKLAEELVSKVTAKIFLAGGLKPDNLAAALEAVKPYGIDIAGGVRSEKNELDILKVAACQKLLKSLTD